MGSVPGELVLREAFDYAFSRLDPVGGAHVDPPAVAVYETVMAKGPDRAPYPMLAESWSVAPGGMEWRVRLRQGLTFHSGDACDAPAVAAALDRLRWGEGAERQLWYWDPVDEVQVEGNDMLLFTLHYPYSRLPSLLWGPHTAIHNEAARTRHGNRYGYDIADGTGPFQLVKWEPERIVADRWPEYKGAGASFFANRGPARINRVEWIAITDEHDRLTALEGGDVHCLHGPPLSEVDRLRSDLRFRVIEYPQASNFYLALDWRRSELGFDNLRVRQAISLGLDRAKLAEDALEGHAAPSLGGVPAGCEFYDPAVDQDVQADVEAAGRLLDEAGWIRAGDGIRTRGGQRLVFECLGQDDTVHRRVAEGVRKQLARLGVFLELHFVTPFADFYEACTAGPPSFISKWLWQDPIDALIGFTASWCRPFPNWQHSSVPALDSAFGRWLRAGDSEDLRKAAGEAQRAIAEHLPYIPLVTPNDIWVHSRRLHGWRPFPASLYPFYQDCWLEE